MSVENRTTQTASEQTVAEQTVSEPTMQNSAERAKTAQETPFAGGAHGGYSAHAQHHSSEPGEETRRMLYRHPGDAVVGGVCGGLADYFGWDAALVRILWVVITLATGGGGLLAYLALWILLPVGTIHDGQQRPATFELNERTLARAAWILISLGVLWFLGNVGILPWLWGGFWRVVSIVFWPLLLVGVGYVLLRYTGKIGNWRTGLDGAAGQVKSSVGERMPSKAGMKSGFNAMRHKLPFKRSRNDRIWMGVCGGLGQRLGLDSNLVRLIWAAFSVGSIGMGVLIYVVAGLFLVEEMPPRELGFEDEDAHEVQIIDATPGRSV